MAQSTFSTTLVVAMLSASATLAQDRKELAQVGKALLVDKCSNCHQVEARGRSPHPEAQPFRTLMQRYSPEDLEEALGEGLTTGHPSMPDFTFEPPEVAAITAYLETLRRRR